MDAKYLPVQTNARIEYFNRGNTHGETRVDAFDEGFEKGVNAADAKGLRLIERAAELAAKHPDSLTAETALELIMKTTDLFWSLETAQATLQQRDRLLRDILGEVEQWPNDPFGRKAGSIKFIIEEGIQHGSIG